MTWQPGRQEVIAALRAGELQRVTGGQAAGDGWITQARRKYETARLISDTDPESSYVTAYDAARFALVGVLAQQGLRPTQKGGHLAVEQAVRAQFGPSFVTFSTQGDVVPNSNTPLTPVRGSTNKNCAMRCAQSSRSSMAQPNCFHT